MFVCLFLFFFFADYYYYYLRTVTTLAFYHSEGNLPFYKHVQKLIPSGLQIDSSQIFNIQILIISSWPWALFGLRSELFLKYHMLKVTGTFFSGRTKGTLLFLLTKEHCLVKMSLKSSAFSLKRMINCRCVTEVEYKVENTRIHIKGAVFMKNQFFDFFIYPWWIAVITGNGFMGNVIRYYILKGLIK